jgi:hypothetical protein
MRAGCKASIALAVAAIGFLVLAGPSTAVQKVVVLEGTVGELDLSRSVPGELSYQGYLINAADSSAVNGTLQMNFRLFDLESGGTEQWNEIHSSVQVSDGLFHVLLGSMTAFPAGLFDGAQLWLETKIGGEMLSPRKPLSSVAYSHRSNSAEKLQDNTLIDLDDRWVNEGQAASVTSSMIIGTVWTADNDGDGSGLDADMLDGQQGSDFISMDDLDHLDASDGNPSNAIFVDADGKVGVGTTTPLTELDVSGSVNAASFYGDGSNLTGISGSPDNDWTVSGNNMYSTVSGNVGIGKTGPVAKLDVSGAVNTDSQYRIEGLSVLSAAGTGNVMVGDGAGGNSSGTYTVCVGDSAGYNNQDAANTFLGYYAGYNNTTGSTNTFVGTETGRSNTAGMDNTYIGQVAGYNIDGSFNTFIGRASGYAKTSGFYNTFIGNDAGGTNFTGDGNVFVGYMAGYHEPGSNKLYIANDRDTSAVLIYGDFSTGRVGLGTLAPAEKLQLHKSSGSLGMRISSGASDYQYINMGAANGYSIGCDGSDRFFLNREQPLGYGVLRILTVLTDGKIGIGTTGPTDELHVVGDIYCTGKLTSDGGNDPPYVLYNKESRSAIVQRVRDEVPEGKKDGAVLFFNGEESRLELYFPEKGEFRDILGNLLMTVADRAAAGGSGQLYEENVSSFSQGGGR